MLKLGVCKPEQFYGTAPSGMLSHLYYRLSRSRVSYCLLEQASRAQDAPLFERLTPHVRLANGVYRTTFRQRFRNLDPVVNALLSRCFPSSDKLAVEDWAASSCLTSAEWAETLLGIFPQATFRASDYMLFLIAVQDRKSGGVFVADQDGQLLQYVHPPFVVRIEPPEPWALPFNRLKYLQARGGWEKARLIWPRMGAWLDQWEGSLELEGYSLSKLPLVHPAAFALAAKNERFSIARHSIFEPARKPCNVIRTMNILNKAYFSADQLRKACQSVVDSLEGGGIWILGRTIQEEPPVSDVTIYRKQSAGRLEVLERLGAGSEIDDIAMGLTPK